MAAKPPLVKQPSAMPTRKLMVGTLAAAVTGTQLAPALAEVWPQIRKISIDFGLMEHAARVSVIPIDIGWSDIGSWGALLDVLSGDEQGNVCVDGDLLALDTRGTYVRSAGRLLATIGLQDMIVVDTPDVLLVCPRARAEEVKDLVARRFRERLGLRPEVEDVAPGTLPRFELKARRFFKL